MQISVQEVLALQKRAARRHPEKDAAVTSVADLAEKWGVDMAEVRRFTEAALMADEDPARERRVRDLASQVAQGRYAVEAEQVLDMAERRSVADRAGDL